MVPSKGFLDGILTFLDATYIIFLLKGGKKQAKDPLSKEPPIDSMVDHGGRASTNDGML